MKFASVKEYIDNLYVLRYYQKHSEYKEGVNHYI